MKKGIVYPNYDRSILNTVASIMKHYNVKTSHSTLSELDEELKKGYKNIVLLIFDGMGEVILNGNRESVPYLLNHRQTTLTSVVPSTTTAAMTTYYTGQSPFEHGWLGWSLYFKEYGRCIDTFINTDSYTGDMLKTSHVAHTLMPYTHLLDHIEEATSHQVKAYMLEPNYHHYRGKNEKIGVSSAEEIALEIKKLAQQAGEKFIFSYLSEPDKTMHGKGCYSVETKAVLKALNDLVENLAEELEDTLLIISADHGLIDVAPIIYLNEDAKLMECLTMPPFIEGRLMSFFVHHHLKETFKERFNQRFQEDFILLTREEALDKQLFGPGIAHAKTLDFIGDFVACAIGDKVLDYKPVIQENELKVEAMHAGLTEDEMVVPLIVISC